MAPIYLKKPSRAAGLIHATFLAMMLDALIERKLRQQMIRHKVQSIPILLMEMFSGVAWFEFSRADETILFPIKLTPLQKQLLRLLGMDHSAYQ